MEVAAYEAIPILKSGEEIHLSGGGESLWWRKTKIMAYTIWKRETYSITRRDIYGVVI